MPSQIAIDTSRHRLRAVEIDGSVKAPRVKAFAAADVLPPPPPAEGQAPLPVSYTDAVRALFAERRMVRDPAGIALASFDCTFRDLELPFTDADQIDKVIKFEAESHLQLVDIDSVVVSYQILDSDHRGGSRLLAMAVQKETLRRILRDFNTAGVDPQVADLHLAALYTALRATGYLVPAPEAAEDAPPELRTAAETLLILEVDTDLTHMLVTCGDRLLAARAIRLGSGVPAAHEGASTSVSPEVTGVSSGTEAAAVAEGVAPVPAPSAAPEGTEGPEGDVPFVVVDDPGEETHDRPAPHASADYFGRMRREVQRTLFKVGPGGEGVSKVLLLGAAGMDESFRAHLESTLRLPVEVARPFDRVEHSLDEETLARANAEGTAALGVALRMLGAQGSRVDFRQEDVRYARRFDQVKVALSCFAIVALVFVALLAIVRVKENKVAQFELMNAVAAIFTEYEPLVDNVELRRKVDAGTVKPKDAVLQARREMEGLLDDLSSELGRSGSIPRLPSGLDYLNAVVLAVDTSLKKMSRPPEIYSWDLDIDKDRPSLKLKALVVDNAAVDELKKALSRCPAVKEVSEPRSTGAKDGRIEVSNLDLELVKDFDPRRPSAKEGAAP